jgi:Natural resistance-associated macrophage protein
VFEAVEHCMGTRPLMPSEQQSVTIGGDAAITAESDSSTVAPTKPRLLRVLGPGLITGASDDDPSGIGTYSQAGAQLGFGISWTMVFTYPLMVAIQEISARVGRVTGRGLGGNICRHYPGWLLQSIVVLLFAANPSADAPIPPANDGPRRVRRRRSRQEPGSQEGLCRLSPG